MAVQAQYLGRGAVRIEYRRGTRSGHPSAALTRVQVQPVPIEAIHRLVRMPGDNDVRAIDVSRVALIENMMQ